MIDTHCHVDFKDYNKNREEVIERAKKDLTCIINSGATLGGNRRTLQLIKDHQKFIYGTFGFHPVNAAKAEAVVLKDVKKEILSNLDKAVALGETGLDFYHTTDLEGKRKQEKVFNSFIDLASEYEMPLLVHARDSERKAFEMVKKYSDIPNVVFHCYSGDDATAKDIIDEGYFISVSSMICFSNHHQNLIKDLPLSYMITETDSPYLSPFKGKRNEPSNVKYVVNKIAEIKDQSFDKIDKLTEKNAKKVFRV
ncbi:MAG: TatD family hydrolase [Methanobacteriaceae archaeon]|nr:TatD family hydrolase [Methanobacteriaceae archaeon]